MRFPSMTFALTVALALASAAPVSAQFPGAGSSMEDGMGGGRSVMSRRPGAGEPMLTEQQLDGPPTPETMRQLLTLEDGQVDAYRQAYETLMRGTQAQRDTARVAFRGMREAFASGNRTGARATGAYVRRLGQELARQDAEFDKAAKALFTKEQRKAYEKWQARNRKEAEELQIEEMRRAGFGR
ncbi:MAG: hypothetical protein H0U85_05015 [Gemmatimonadales bacterium]|nr:hypothetical protein [Gemmatimonadales bacterium]